MKIPQVTYGQVEKITRGTGEIEAAGQETRQRLALVEQAGETFHKAYTAHVAADTRNKFVDARAAIAQLEQERMDDANRLIDPEELRAHGIEVEGDAPVKGSIYAAPLFEKKAAAVRDQIGATVPAMFREKYDAATEDLVLQSSNRVYNKAKEWQKDENTADFAQNTTKMLLAGQWDAARSLANQALEEGTLDNNQRLKAIQNVDEAEAIDPAMKAIAGDSQTRLEEEIEKFKDPEYSGPLDSKTRLSIVASLEQRRVQLEREFQKADTETKLRLYGDMSVGVQYGTGKQRVTPIQIERMYVQEAITVEQRNSLTHQYWARVAAEDKAYKGMINVEDAMKNGVRLSHTNKNHRAWVNAHTSSIYGTSVDAQRGTREQRRAFETGNVIIAAETGILGEEAQAYLVGMNRSPDPERSVEAANFYAQLAQEAPQTLLDVPERDRIRMEVTATMAASGMPAAQAVRYGQEAADRPPEQQEQLKSTYMEAIKASGDSNRTSLDNFLNSNNHMDPWLGAPAASNNAIRSEYEGLVSVFFGQTGDLKLSREMAQTRLLTTWGRSEINGTAMAMKYSPEVMTGLSSSELRASLEAQVAATTFTTLSSGGPISIDPKKVIVTSDVRTGKDSKYALQIVRPDGMIDNIYTADGKRAYWDPTPARNAAAKAKQDEVDRDARQKQKLYREMVDADTDS